MKKEDYLLGGAISTLAVLHLYKYSGIYFNSLNIQSYRIYNESDIVPN